MYIRCGIEMGCLVMTEFNKAAALHLQVCVVFHLIDAGRQRLQPVFLYGMKTFLAAVWAFLHASLVE